MKYKEITVFAKDEAELSALTEGLAALGTDQLIIADPADAELLTEETWGYTGSWVDRNGKEQLRVIKNAKGEVSFSYNLPMVAKGNAFQVSFGGLNVMISKLDSARVCWSTIENCDTIPLRNAANNATYKLTRVTK